MGIESIYYGHEGIVKYETIDWRFANEALNV